MQPAKIPHMFLNGAESFVWQHDKPLYLRRVSVDSFARSVVAHRVLRRRSLSRLRAYRNRAKAESWRMQILGYRDLEVGGMSPWTVIEGGPLDETNPLYQAHR